MDGRGIKDLHKYGEEMSKNSSLPSREQQETSELNGSGGGRGKGIRGARPFVPVGGTNRDKMGAFCPGWWFQPGQKARVAFCPGWCLQPGQKALRPLSPSLSPRLSHSAHLFSCCSWLGIEEFLLISSPHL